MAVSKLLGRGHYIFVAAAKTNLEAIWQNPFFFQCLRYTAFRSHGSSYGLVCLKTGLMTKYWLSNQTSLFILHLSWDTYDHGTRFPCFRWRLSLDKDSCSVTPVPAAMRAFNQLKQSYLLFDRLWNTKTGILLHRSGENNRWAACTGGRMAMAGEYSARWHPSLWCINHQ